MRWRARTPSSGHALERREGGAASCPRRQGTSQRPRRSLQSQRSLWRRQWGPPRPGTARELRGSEPTRLRAPAPRKAYGPGRPSGFARASPSWPRDSPLSESSRHRGAPLLLRRTSGCLAGASSRWARARAKGPPRRWSRFRSKTGAHRVWRGLLPARVGARKARRRCGCWTSTETPRRRCRTLRGAR